MMKFRKRDSRKMLKEVARLRGLSVSEVRGQIQDAILEAKNSDNPDQQAEFQRLFVFFVKYFSLKKASEFPFFSKGFSLPSAGIMHPCA